MEELSRNFVDIRNEETLYQVYGFGTKDGPEPCFPLNGDEDPTVEGFDDVKKTYTQNANEFKGSEDFSLAPVLRKFKEQMESMPSPKEYKLLLITIPDTTPA